MSSDPTYDRKEIDAHPVWKRAFALSENENDTAPIGWGLYIRRAKKELNRIKQVSALLDEAKSDYDWGGDEDEEGTLRNGEVDFKKLKADIIFVLEN